MCPTNEMKVSKNVTLVIITIVYSVHDDLPTKNYNTKNQFVHI